MLQKKNTMGGTSVLKDTILIDSYKQDVGDLARQMLISITCLLLVITARQIQTISNRDI